MRRMMSFPCLGVVLVCLLTCGCPDNNDTFPFYVVNLSSQSLTEFKLYDEAEGSLVNVLSEPLPGSTLVVIQLDLDRFGASMGGASYALGGGAANEIIARVDDPPGNVGFAVKEVNAVTTVQFFTVNDTTKSVPVTSPDVAANPG